jgi:hypothetical protein
MPDRRGMTQQRRPDSRRGRPGDPQDAPRHRDRTPRDPGAYIGRMPERATETIPGGLGPKDERVAAVGTQPAPVRGSAPAATDGSPPEGHREAENATDDRVREAGQNR